MADKPKGFGKPLHQKQMEESQRKDMEKLSKKVLNGEFGGKFAGTMISPSGEVKMSEVLEDFVEPYLEFVRNNHQQRKHLFGMAMTAWNLSLLPEDERELMLEKAIKQATAGTDLLKQGFSAIIGSMITRKLDYFADNRRLIVNFELKDMGDGFQLLVASTLEQNP
ncbi:MAG: hypothetical protein HC860_23725 [Alkalinema sp. RU_4_3]|nr:hypothetical protein [Alkalinema sp. RU_4_3]